METRRYAEARHELLDETNRDEVTGDVLGSVEAVAQEEGDCG